jgi:inhibitor of cysteine peptidase
MKHIFLSMLILCASLFMGCSSKQAGSNNADNSSKLNLKAGDSFIIRLESNPTTGYSWSLAEPLSEILQKVSNVYEPYKTDRNVVGSGGTEVWTFKAVSKGNVTLIFQYARAWEKDVPPIKKEIYQITVE